MSEVIAYPPNVCVHGNGFVQISLGGSPETRIHVWHPDLPDCQHVNTSLHDHRFGFVSTVLRGRMTQEELWYGPDHTQLDLGTKWQGLYNLWRVGRDRLPTGNRPLIKQPGGPYRLATSRSFYVHPGTNYSMGPRRFHRTVPYGTVVTLMTKTTVLPTSEYRAAVLCKEGLEPDQEFDRFQVPFPLLEGILADALRGTPFEEVDLW